MALGMELGTGRTAFVELPADEGELEIESGPQGGWHFWVTLRLLRYDLAPFEIDYRASSVADESLGHPARFRIKRELLLEQEPGVFYRIGDRIILDIDRPEDVVGDLVRLEARAFREDRELANATRTIRVVDRIDELR
jgi:hypothetical protein